jgi:hypothetical protein
MVGPDNKAKNSNSKYSINCTNSENSAAKGAE